MIKASDFITRVQGVKAKAGYIVKDSQSSSVLYFFNLSDSSVIPLSDVYIPDTKVQEPEYHGSSGGSATGMNFYKCASVNTSDSTWSGYKAVQDQTTKMYSFQNVLTQDPLIFYPSKMVPKVDKVYTADAICCVDLYDQQKAVQNNLASDLIFYAPLTQSAGTRAVVGVDQQPILSSGLSQVYATIKGIQCIYINDSGGSIQYTTPQGLVFSDNWTFSIWVYPATLAASKSYVAGMNTQGFGWICFSSGKNPILTDPSATFSQQSAVGVWHNYTVTRSSGHVIKLYMDGVYVDTTTDSYSSNNTSNAIKLGYVAYWGPGMSEGYYTHLRIYNKVLPDSKILSLANQLHPTNS